MPQKYPNAIDWLFITLALLMVMACIVARGEGFGQNGEQKKPCTWDICFLNGKKEICGKTTNAVQLTETELWAQFGPILSGVIQARPGSFVDCGGRRIDLMGPVTAVTALEKDTD